MIAFSLNLGKDIVAAKVPFHPGVYSSLEIQFRGDFDYPDSAEYAFERRGALWFASHPSGLVRFYSHPGDGRDHGGYGGSEYSLRMLDGSAQVLKGPWSSNSGAMNAAGFTPSEHCTFTGARQGYRLAGHVTRELWLAAFKHFDVAACIWSTEDGNDWTLTQSPEAYRDRRYVRRVDPARELKRVTA